MLGRIPRYPEDAAHILDAEKAIEAIIAHMDGQGKVVIAGAGDGDKDGEEDGDGDGDRAEGRVFCAKMFSHRWERSSPDPACAHPDDPAHKKARALSSSSSSSSAAAAGSGGGGAAAVGSAHVI